MKFKSYSNNKKKFNKFKKKALRFKMDKKYKNIQWKVKSFIIQRAANQNKKTFQI